LNKRTTILNLPFFFEKKLAHQNVVIARNISLQSLWGSREIRARDINHKVARDLAGTAEASIRHCVASLQAVGCVALFREGDSAMNQGLRPAKLVPADFIVEKSTMAG